MEPNALIFRKPPVTEVRTEVTFRNTLEVADCRSEFYKLVRDEFPHVWMPDKSKLSYDFGDYSLRTENGSYRLEIGMNYFRLVTPSYSGFDEFKKRFTESAAKFAQCYGIKSFLQFSMQYNNRLPFESESSFEDCFSIKLTVANTNQPLFAGKGVMIFEHPEGYAAIEIDPQFADEKITSYILTLGFSSQRELVYDEPGRDFVTLLQGAHDYIEKYFVSLLEPKYLQYLKSL